MFFKNLSLRNYEKQRKPIKNVVLFRKRKGLFLCDKDAGET